MPRPSDGAAGADGGPRDYIGGGPYGIPLPDYGAGIPRAGGGPLA